MPDFWARIASSVRFFPVAESARFSDATPHLYGLVQLDNHTLPSFIYRPRLAPGLRRFFASYSSAPGSTVNLLVPFSAPDVGTPFSVGETRIAEPSF
jgi:hypothetical protein